MLFPWAIGFFNTFGKSWTLFFFRLLRNRFFPTRSKHEYSPNGFKQTRAEHEQFLWYLPTIDLGITKSSWNLKFLVETGDPKEPTTKHGVFHPILFVGSGSLRWFLGILIIFQPFFPRKKGFYRPGVPFWGYDVFAKLFDPIISRCVVFAVKTPWNELQKSPWNLMVGRRSPLPFGFRSFFRRKTPPIFEKPVHLHLPWKKSTQCRYKQNKTIHGYMDGIWGIYFAPAIPENFPGRKNHQQKFWSDQAPAPSASVGAWGAWH